MNKLFSKIATLSVGLAMAVGVGVAANSGSRKVEEVKAASESVDFTAQGYTNQQVISSYAGSNFTLTFDKGSNNNAPKYYTSGTAIRAYGGNTITATSSSTITSIVITFGSSDGSNAITTDVGSYSSGTWSGSSSTVVFTIGGTTGNRRLSSMSFTFDGGDVPTTYTVVYNSNGGTGTMTDENSPYEPGDEVTVLDNSFEKENYNFTKWNTKADGSGTNYNGGDTFEISGNVTLYAQWVMGQTYVDDLVNQTITWDLSEASYTSASTTQVSWESPKVNMVADKASAGTATNNYLPPSNTSSRFYKNSTLTFTQLNDNGIIKIEATATTSGYALALANSTWTNATASADDTLATITAIDGSSPIVGTISATTGLSQVVVYYGTPTPVTKYEVIDRIDDGSLNQSEVVEGATLTVTILPDDGYDLPESLDHVYMAGQPVEYTYSNGVVTVINVQGNITIEGTCIKVNQIKALYSKASGASVDVYGYYVGFLDGTGPVIMDGEYGVVIYNKTADVSGYKEKETILHVTGSISIYKGLYEIGSASMSVASEVPEDKVPSNPVVYTTQGDETADYASRLTTVTGTPSLVSGSFDDAAGTADIKMNFAVGTKSVQVFYKKAAQTADSNAFNAIKSAVADSEEITIKGFTGWYNGFQVQMNGVVEAVESYTAEDFAQDLLDQTDDACSAYPGDKDPSYNYNTYKAALVAIWSDLASAEKYPSLSSDQKQILANADRNEEGSVIEQAMARYDFLTGKYKLNNFINGRTPMSIHYNNLTIESNNSYIIVIIAISSVAVLSLGVLLILKKKKHN